MNKKQGTEHELLSLMNIGQKTFRDLKILRIESIEVLSHQDPNDLYEKLQKITKKRHDPCVRDVFSAIIHEAKTGEKSPWWKWTASRKLKPK